MKYSIKRLSGFGGENVDREETLHDLLKESENDSVLWITHLVKHLVKHKYRVLYVYDKSSVKVLTI